MVPTIGPWAYEVDGDAPAVTVIDADRDEVAVGAVPVAFPGVVVAVSDGPGGRLPAGPDGWAGVDVALTTAASPPAPWVQVGDVDAEIANLRATLAGPLRTAACAYLHVLRVGDQLSGGEPASGLVLESFAYSMLQAGPAFAAWRAGRPVRARRPAAEPEVLVERTGDVLAVTLNRPEVHNAYNRRVRDLLCEALSVALVDPACRVELEGRGPSFCSGGDLDEFGTAPEPATAHLVRVGRSPARILATIGSRVTARLHGSCAGSGIELPAWAGRVVAAPDTRIWLPELAMGLIPGAGGTASLPRRIGRHRTAWLGLTGRPIDAGTALAWGLADEIDSAGGGPA